jgi:hypothetical protein
MDPIVALTPAQEVIQEQQAASEGWAHRSIVAFDQLVNVFLLRGQPGETISTHAARADRLGNAWGVWMSRFLNIFQSDHGAKARAGDIQRAKNLLKIEESWHF